MFFSRLLNQVTKGLAKTIRAMADGTLDSPVGARICNGLGIMRACLETQKLEQLEARMDEITRHRTTAAGGPRLPWIQLLRLTRNNNSPVVSRRGQNIVENRTAAGRHQSL